MEAIRMLLAFACHHEFKLFQMDVKSAFLNGFINEEVYVEQPPGFEDPKFSNHVFKLSKALYGLKQAPRAWYERLSTFLVEKGFSKGKVDTTLFIKNDGKDILVVQIYVDDIIFSSTNELLCQDFAKLMQGEFEMSMMGELSFFLGLQIKQRKDGIFINQAKYIKEKLKKFGFENVKPQATPMSSSIKLDKDEKGKCVDSKLYRSMIGSLLYLTASRPDIMFSVCLCARFQANPKESHLKAIKRIFRYLQDTPSLGLWYARDSTFDLHAYSDADYGGCKVDRKSTSGTCQFLGNMLISWFSKKQNSVALSTTEAEYISAGSCCAQVLWMKQQLLDYGIDVGTIPIKCDNTSVICLTKNPIQHSRTKHIEIRHHFIRDHVSKNDIVLEYVDTLHQLADIFTKPLDKERFWTLRHNGIGTDDTVAEPALWYRYEFQIVPVSSCILRSVVAPKLVPLTQMVPNPTSPSSTMSVLTNIIIPMLWSTSRSIKTIGSVETVRPHMSFLTSTAFNFRYLEQLKAWKFDAYLRLLARYYHNLVLIFYSNARCIFNEAKEEIEAVESYLMGKTFRITPKVIATSLGLEDVGLADEGPNRHIPHGSVRDLDAHDRFLHLLITWCFRPSGGKWSTIRNVDSFWMHCFRQNTRPNLARIMFINIVDLVRDQHLVSVKSFNYRTALSYIFEKPKIDCSADLAIPLTDPINDKSLRKAGFTKFNNQWVHNAELPQGVKPADADDPPQAPIAPPPQAFSLDPIMQYLDGKFTSLATHMEEQFASINARLQAIESRQNSMDITLNAFRGEWRGHNLGPLVEDEDDEEKEDEEDIGDDDNP
ncbi:hypothetical protein V6N11_077761 [Hibiscus sabdariffa]|uniref:Reverse transcriptase Ty1/copia-type domain-containing protein n=1 Tax=Hibiscus sabdariffa TaxID=183260 RepID=A0ABR2TDZ6_9ROSI